MTSLLAATALLCTAIADPDPDDIVQKNLKDVSFTLVIEKADQKELGKINKDFGTSYRADSGKAYFKDPFKFRIESKYGETNVYYVLNGGTAYYRLGRAGIGQKMDVSGSPGRIQTLLDFGVLVPSLLTFFEAKYVRTDRATGAYVFDLLFKKRKPDDNTRHRIWVEPKLKYVMKREWFNRDGDQLATFTYSEPHTANGCTFPGRAEVRNTENRLGGIMLYKSVQFNTGLSESLFSIK
ncbi:MAG: outer membrane lipoprotein-sorting protein [Armatimonadetes bacterium]|nr:outer membrane lipoprotein-sorting protein [Armatimonadota bacterium]